MKNNILNMKNITIILDRAHGEDTAGKRSPDGLHREWKWSSDRIAELKEQLESLDYIVYETVTEDTEPGLTQRVKRANAFEGDNKLLLSVHNNAAGMGVEWMNATGFAAYTCKGQTKSDDCAEIILNNLRIDFPELKLRKDTVDGDLDCESNFTVLMGNYMAVLLEWLFQDSKNDVDKIEDVAYNERLITSLVNSIEEINNLF